MLAMTRRKPQQLPPDIVIGEADNPYTHDGAQRKIQVAYSTRDDPLRGMRSRNQIDEAQFQAGMLFQLYLEQAEIGFLKAIDTTKEPVDGGGSFPDPITDRQKRAVEELNDARSHLGSYGYELIASVVGRRLSIVQASAERKMVSKRGELYIGRRLGECLDTLAVLWGLAGKPR